MFPLPATRQKFYTGAKGHLNVINAHISTIHPYSGDTVDWLIKIARLIFQPLGTSSLYVPTQGGVGAWLKKDFDMATWTGVEAGDPLRATIYEFRPDHDAPIILTQISMRQQHSVTTSDTMGASKTFRSSLEKRDHRCIISGLPAPNHFVASHLIPKRIGDAGL